MSHFVLSAWVTFFSTSFLASLVFVRGKAKLHRIFSAYSLCIALWALCFTQHVSSGEAARSLLWSRPLHIFAAFIPVLFLNFTFALISADRAQRILLKIITGVAVFFAGLSALNSPFFMSGVRPRPGLNNLVESGPLYPFFFAFFAMCAMYGLWLIWRAYLGASGISKAQLRYLLLGSLLGYSGGIDNFLIVFDVRLPLLAPFGTYAIPLYVLIASYAIIRYRLMDVSVVLSRFAIFIFFYAPLLLLPIGVGKLLEPFLLARLGSSWWMAPMVVEALFAAGGLMAFQKLQRRAEARLRAEELEAHRKLRELSQDILRFTELKPLLDQIVHRVVKVLKVTHAAVYLTNPEDGSCKRQSAWDPQERTSSLPESVPEDSAFIRDLATTRIPRVREELKLQQQAAPSDWREMVSAMDQLRAAVVIPAFKPERLFGFLVLGDKRSGRIWTQDDLNMLTLLANQAALAIENVQLHEAQADRLIKEAVDKTAVQIARGVGHQFGNTLNDVKLLADTLLLTLKSKPLESLSPTELLSFAQRMMKNLLRISREAEIGGGIATGVLNLTKPVPQEFKPVDVKPLIEDSIIRVLQKHAAEKVEDEAVTPAMLNGVPATLPKVSGSEAQISQVIYNLLDNAVDAIREKIFQLHKGWIPAPSEPYKGRVQIKAQASGERLTVVIEDDGIGITPENMKQLFVPFFTTKGQSKGRGLGGHGAGLIVIQKIIEGHGGKIRVASELTQGTRFTIDLPVWRESHGA